ncbi:MAG TPA: TMEM175 family protein [Holophaga sp.]|nr:TMEM175 family protein [Holophaga sp.]
MPKTRLEAFSDGVLAIILTIMVLEMKVPHGNASWAALRPAAPVLLSYVLSFVYLGIYWNNHHHLLQAAKHVNGSVLWANLHLLFWLSLMPFASGWMGGTGFQARPVALYGVVMLMAAVAYFLLSRALVRLHGEGSALARAVGRDAKGVASVVAYLAALGLSLRYPGASLALYVGVAVAWFIPDRRIERALGYHA